MRSWVQFSPYQYQCQIKTRTSHKLPPVPVTAIVVFLMRQKRADVDVPFGLLFIRPLRIMDDGDKPVPVLSDVKGHVAIHTIGILEPAAHFRKIVPRDRLDDAHPRFDFARRIRMIPRDEGAREWENDQYHGRFYRIFCRCGQRVDMEPPISLNFCGYSAVVGSITDLTSETRFAGKPPCSACSRTIFSSGAM
jgi:hypothetical protein